jgi:porin
MTLRKLSLAFIAACSMLTSNGLATDSSTDPCATCAPPPAPPMPIYDGCIHDRQVLLGDWGGCRTKQLGCGMLWQLDNTDFYFGTASGGRDQAFTFAGHGDYVLNWDMSKVGMQEGFFMKLRAEHRYGENISDYSGTFLPPTIQTNIPVADSEQVYLTNVLFTQALSENFAIFAGKLDTFDGDTNAFAAARGKDQFSNMGFVVNPLLIRMVPYSTLGTGFVILEEMQPIFQFTVLNATDTTNTSGFSQIFDQGAALLAQARLPYEWGGQPGHFVLGGGWNSREYVSLGQDPRIVLPDVPINRQRGTWAVYSNFDQYLTTYDGAPGKGWGLFGRASIGDDETNPIAHYLSAGIGGDNAYRLQDKWGAGYYHLATSSEIGPFLTAALGPIGNGDGVELFYNHEVTPWFHLTGDMQVLVPEVENNDTALIVGLRGKIDF